MLNRIKSDNLWIGLIASMGLLLAGCNLGPTAAAKAPSTNSRASSTTLAPASGSTATPAPSTGGGASTDPAAATEPPKEYLVEGLGNHARHICVPAESKLLLRIKAYPNVTPLFPANAYLINARDGLPLYDGSPATYSKLRVKLSIPGTEAAWDFTSNVGYNSVIGDYSDYLHEVQPATVASTSALATPEYSDQRVVYGSNPLDGMCTYWEHMLGRCEKISSALRTAETAKCKAGEQKIMITNIISDYPCQNDRTGWCNGGQLQMVPDYQRWAISVQAVTEKTQVFKN